MTRQSCRFVCDTSDSEVVLSILTLSEFRLIACRLLWRWFRSHDGFRRDYHEDPSSHQKCTTFIWQFRRRGSMHNFVSFEGNSTPMLIYCSHHQCDFCRESFMRVKDSTPYVNATLCGTVHEAKQRCHVVAPFRLEAFSRVLRQGCTQHRPHDL